MLVFQTAAFARQVIFTAAVRDVAADSLLAQPVIDRGVDVIDAGVEHLVENGFGLGLGEYQCVSRSVLNGLSQLDKPLL